jgi:hypothetical protein
MRVSLVAIVLIAYPGTAGFTVADAGTKSMAREAASKADQGPCRSQDTGCINQVHYRDQEPVSTLAIEIQERLALALGPSGRHADAVARRQAIEWLIAHSDQVHPHLLEWLRREPQGLHVLAILELLPAFARPEAVPLLGVFLESDDEYIAEIAGKALGRHPATEAQAALVGALASDHAYIVAAAADGLLLRADSSGCKHLLAALPQADPIARYHVMQAAARLGCLSRQQLADVAAGDEDPDIRQLAASYETADQVSPDSSLDDAVGTGKGAK